MALTQVVEHHLPTYASLAFVEQKWEWKEKLEWKSEKMKMHNAENATQHTSFIIWPKKLQYRNVSATRGQLEGYSLGSAAIPVSFCFFAGQSSRTNSELQATIKGWWWLRTTLWFNSGWSNWFLRTTYICTREQNVSAIEVQENLTSLQLINWGKAVIMSILPLKGNWKRLTKLENSRNISKG